VQLYDTLPATKVEDLGATDFEYEIKSLNVPVLIPSWFTVGLHTSVR